MKYTKENLKTYRYLLGLFILAVIVSIPLYVWAEWITQLNPTQEITLSPAEIIEQDVLIRLNEANSVNLCFEFPQSIDPTERRANRDRIFKLVGIMKWDQQGKLIKEGVEVSVRVSLFDALNGSLILSKEASTTGANFHSGSRICRTIPKFGIYKGRYKLKVEILKDVPEFKNIKTYIAIYPSYSKGCSTFTCGFLFFGQFFNFFILLPFICLMALYLIIQGIIWHLASRKGKPE